MQRITADGISLGGLAEVLQGTLVNPAHADIKVFAVVAAGGHQVPRSVFVAIQGQRSDGHDFIAEALTCGSVAAVVSDPRKLENYPGVVVADTRAALSKLAGLFSGNPTREMAVIGLTGTNGKTTTNWVLYHLLNRLGRACIRIGTLGVRTESGLDRPGNLTTPDPLGLHADIAQAFQSGARSCVIETSSHALHQRRVDDLAFDVGIFTNLTRDHLDYHGDMETYFLAKKHLFELMAKGEKSAKTAVINADDEYGQRLRAEIAALGLHDLSFAWKAEAPFRIRSFECGLGKSRLDLEYEGKIFVVRTSYMGQHNAENLAAAFAALVGLGYSPEKIAAEMAKLPQVPGRLEAVGNNDLHVFVDYAHTPDALKHALQCLREVTRQKLWVIFGCGGDRDRGKRPQMAEVAARLADYVVVTSDNPRTEDPLRIIGDILSGREGPAIRRAGIIEPDRRSAIERTLLKAERGDVILIAGKGHEDYQILGTRKIHFSDQQEVKRVLSGLENH